MTATVGTVGTGTSHSPKDPCRTTGPLGHSVLGPSLTQVHCVAHLLRRDTPAGTVVQAWGVKRDFPAYSLAGSQSLILSSTATLKVHTAPRKPTFVCVYCGQFRQRILCFGSGAGASASLYLHWPALEVDWLCDVCRSASSLQIVDSLDIVDSRSFIGLRVIRCITSYGYLHHGCSIAG